MMSDPEKWEEIFKYTIDQTSPDQERKEQMWNRLQSTISGRGQKWKQAIRSGWQPHGRKTFAAALAGTCVIAVCLLTGVGVNAATDGALFDSIREFCGLPVQQKKAADEELKLKNEVYAPELAGCSEKYVVFANERALMVYGRQEKSFWRHWICRQWTAIILIPTVSIPVCCCRKTRYIFLMRKRNSSQRRCMCMILKRLMYHPRFP